MLLRDSDTGERTAEYLLQNQLKEYYAKKNIQLEYVQQAITRFQIVSLNKLKIPK